MSIEAAKEIIAKLDLQIGERPLGNPFFKDPDVIAYPFEKKSFHHIRTVASDRKLAFVDGGNLELIGAPNFSVQLNRVYSCVWKHDKRQKLTEIPQIEFYSAIYSTIRDGDISFEAIIIPANKEHSTYVPNSADFVMKHSVDVEWDSGRANGITQLASVIRSAAEWKMAQETANLLDKDDVVVLDGSLQVFQRDWKYFLGLEGTTKRKGIVLAGLSKSSSLFTDSGASVLGAASEFADQHDVVGEWYHPVFESRKHRVYCLVVKLKSFSDRVFRLDFQLDQYKQLSEEDLDSILSLFCSNSADPTFAGYPFGLVDADLSSRVSKYEIDYYRALLSSQISAMKRQGRFVSHIRARDAHDLLNAIAGF